MVNWVVAGWIIDWIRVRTTEMIPTTSRVNKPWRETQGWVFLTNAMTTVFQPVTHITFL